jgi:hypothetical protein
MTESGHAPGWYPDPTRRFESRYLDGGRWTEHVFGRGIQSVDPLPALPRPAEVATIPAKAPAVYAPAPQSKRAAKKQGRDEFESTALSAAHGDSEALASLPAVVGRAQQLYRNSQFQKRVWEVVAIAIRDVLNDDRLSLAEEERISRLAGVLGVNLAELPHRNFDLWEELSIAGINAGRLPRVSDSPIVTKPGEIVHAAMIVDLTKEVAVREMRGGYSGVSIRVMKGVNYRVGQVRAHSVVVGTQLQVQDTGTLAITSKRAVFVGRQKTLEFRYDRLLGMEQFKDGLRLNVSNRQAASLFRFKPGQSPSIAAAIMSTAQG